MVSSKLDRNWRNNRQTSIFKKIRRWSSNPIGAFVRIIEVIYFGSPLVLLYRKDGNLTYISHLGNSVKEILNDDFFYHLRDITMSIEENFFLLDSGHICNTRIDSHEILSGQYWSQIRGLQKHNSAHFDRESRIYPIAIQKYYYHFVIEELPEILDAREQYPDIQFISLPGQPKFVLEYLELANIDLEIVAGSEKKFKIALIPSYSRSSTLWSVQKLQRAYPDKKPIFRKILLLRQGLSRRDFKLEESLKAILLPEGFEIINPDEFDVKEQIEIFRSCTHIVGVHGAALTNIVFSNHNCRVFEVFSHPYRASDFFQHLATLNGNNYQSSEKDEAISKLKLWLK